MASKRMIAEDIFEDDVFCTMSLLGRLTWIGMIVNCADDQGRMIDNPVIIRAKVFPADRDISDKDIENILILAHQEGLIVRYTDGKKRLIQVVNWWRYQSPSWASPSKYSPPKNWIDRTKYHASGNKIVSEHWGEEGGFVKSKNNTSSALDSALDSGIEDVKRREEERREEEGEENLPLLHQLPVKQKPSSWSILSILGKVGMSAMPPSEHARTEQITCMVEIHGLEKTEDALVRNAQKWRETKNKNGRPYPVTNMAWVDWAQEELDAGSSVMTREVWNRMNDKQKQEFINAGGEMPL